MSAELPAQPENAFRLRPHHGLCMKFFIGKGYSGDFAENMGNIKTFLETNDPVIVISKGADSICRKCPNNCGGKCSGEKADKYDRLVMELCGIKYGAEMLYSKYSSLVNENILSSGKLRSVCGDCKWFGICGSWQDLTFCTDKENLQKNLP